MPDVRNGRVLVPAGLVVAVVIVGAIVIAASSSDQGSSGRPKQPPVTTHSRLTFNRVLQREAGYEELVVNLPDRRLNTTETSGGATSVLLRCVDRNGRETIRQHHDWPLLEEYGYPTPHVHQPASAKVLDTLHACRMTGRGINFEGRVRGRLRSSQ